MPRVTQQKDIHYTRTCDATL